AAGKPSYGLGVNRARLLELPARISACSEMRELLDLLARELPALLPVSDRISIVFLDEDREWMRIYRVGLAGSAETLANPLPRVRVQGTPVGQVVLEGVARISDAKKDAVVNL